MNKFNLNLYKGKIKVKSSCVDDTMLTMGIVRKLTNLIDFEVEKNVFEMTKLINKEWSALEDILKLLFCDIEPKEWDRVRTPDIIKFIKWVISISVSEILLIPHEDKEPNPFIERRTPTFGESLFRMEYNLCQTFGGYTPDMLDRMAYKEVIEIYANMRRVQIDAKREAEIQRELDEKGIKYVPTKSNDW